MPKRDAYESDNGFVEDAPSKKKQRGGTAKADSSRRDDDDGSVYWEISEFRGKSMINIREYYEKDGKKLPGKKGITLTVEQFAAAISVLPQVEDALHAKGIKVPRPHYDKEEVSVGGSEDDDSVNDAAKEVKPSSSRRSERANHEATDDED